MKKEKTLLSVKKRIKNCLSYFCTIIAILGLIAFVVLLELAEKISLHGILANILIRPIRFVFPFAILGALSNKIDSKTEQPR
jgi:hypothetical protein